MKSWRLGLLCLALTGAIAACTGNNNPADSTGAGRTLGHLGFTTFADENSEAILIRIVDKNGTGISGASVLIGGAPNDPFPGNQLITDANGYATPPAAWKSDLPLTVEATNFVRTTFIPVAPGQIQLELRPADGPNNFQASGQTQGFGDLRTDGKVDFGLVLPAIFKDQILQFDLMSLVSPEVDSITVAGRTVEIPSNITLPQQRENYSIFPINLNKPNYRMFVRQTGNYNVVAMHGQFPLQTVVDELRAGKSMFEMIKYFTFLSAGIVQSYIGDSGLSQTLDVSPIPFNQSITKYAPSLPAGQQMMAVALADGGNYYYPTDVKTVESNQYAQLVGAQGYGSSVLSILRMDTGDQPMNSFQLSSLLGASTFNVRTWAQANANPALGQLSFALQPSYETAAPAFLNLIPAPVVSGQSLLLTPPAQVAGVTPVATFLIYSLVETTGGSSVKMERRTRLWEVVSPGWVNQVDLPNVALNPQPNKTYRWEVLYLGRAGSSNVSKPLEGITHVTRNAVDL